MYFTYLGRSMFAVVFLLFAVTDVAFAQTSSAILTGTAHDATGAILSGVKITATSAERNTAHSTVTNDVGSYVIPALNPGYYAVAAELARISHR
jgi:hypothetical protein